MAESWCKVSSTLDGHPKIRKAGRNGREVFLFALRRNALPENECPGSVSAAELDPDYLAYELMMPSNEAVTAVTACVTAGLLVPDGDRFLIGGWSEEWGRKAKSNAERQAEHRKRTKERQGDPKSVTASNAPKVTRNGSNALEERRGEEKRERQAEPGHGPGTPLAPEPPKPQPETTRPRAISTGPEISANAKLVSWGMDEVDRIRSRVASRFGWTDVRPLHPQDAGRGHLRERLVESGDRAEENLKHVLAIAEAEAVTKRTVEYVGGAMFKSESWGKKLAMRIEDARRVPGSFPGSPASVPTLRVASRADDAPPMRDAGGTKP